MAEGARTCGVIFNRNKDSVDLGQGTHFRDYKQGWTDVITRAKARGGKIIERLQGKKQLG